MVTKTIDLSASITDLETLLKLVEENVEVLLMNGDIPIARLSPLEAPVPGGKTRVAGLHAGTTWVSDDFDAPLSRINVFSPQKPHHMGDGCQRTTHTCQSCRSNTHCCGRQNRVMDHCGAMKIHHLLLLLISSG